VIGNRIKVSVTGYDAEKIWRWEYSTDGGATWTNVDNTSPDYRHLVTADTKFRAYFDFGSFGSGYSDMASLTAQSYTQAHPNPIFVYGDSLGNYVKENVISIRDQKNPSSIPSLAIGPRKETNKVHRWTWTTSTNQGT
jgi:hypothetical protein